MPESKRPVAVEDLLRLKRAERPPAEFWDGFDRELRAKQLAALVQKRPWWQRMPQLTISWRRLHLPLGATAVLAVTLLSLREFSAVNDPIEAEVPLVRETVAKAVESPVAVADEPPAAPQSLASVRAVVEHAEPAVVNDAPALPEARTGSHVDLSRMVALVSAGVMASASDEDLAPSARYIAANLAAATPVQTGLRRRSLLVAPAAEVRASRGAAIEPLAQITPPSEARRARILSALSVASVVDMNGRSAEREARRLSDERLNDHVRRISLTGNTFSFKL